MLKIKAGITAISGDEDAVNDCQRCPFHHMGAMDRGLADMTQILYPDIYLIYFPMQYTSQYNMFCHQMMSPSNWHN